MKLRIRTQSDADSSKSGLYLFYCLPHITATIVPISKDEHEGVQDIRSG